MGDFIEDIFGLFAYLLEFSEVNCVFSCPARVECGAVDTWYRHKLFIILGLNVRANAQPDARSLTHILWHL